MIYPSDIWLIQEAEIDQFLLSGPGGSNSKIIYIAESIPEYLKMHPAILTAAMLLPPMEEVEAELDGRYQEAESIYDDFLHRSEASRLINIFIATAIKNIRVGIVFGRDELNMKFPSMLINHLYKFYGITIGVPYKLNPYIEITMVPLCLGMLYNINYISYEEFIMLHPELPVHPCVLSKLVYDVRPFVKTRDVEHYIEYFGNLISRCKQSGKYLIDPLMEV